MATKGLEIPRHDNLCALCRCHEADETGSHMAPNFIIHKAFAFDGKGKRDHEISYLTHLNEDGQQSYYGRGVSPDAISADMGHEMTEKEVNGNVNNLVYDHIFCRDCEKRFGVLETEYAKFYTDGKQISPRISYLFWLSVFWRMSIGYMATTLDIRDELEIKKILDENVLSREDMITSHADLGNFGYIVFHAEGIIKGDSGIFGTRATHCPYVIILNDLIIALVRDNSKTHRITYRSISSDYVNSWSDDDIYVEEISLETFARMKRWIIDESLANGYGKTREKVERHLYEVCRHEGTPDAFAENQQLLEEARSTDVECDGLPPKMVRNARRFWIAELKEHAANRLGKGYDFMKDRSLFLFPFDVDNYKSDLLYHVRKGQCVLCYPMAKQFLPRKYWADEIGSNLEFDYESFIDHIIESGYTLEDILERNCCTRSNAPIEE